MGLFSVMGNSFGCSASGERLVSAARDGDIQEAKALLEYNPQLVRYSTFGLRNSPLHCSASKGHHEIVSLLLDSGVNVDLRNTRGQTALMQACQFGHWEVVQTLMLYRANIHRTDYLNGGTAIHFASINGHFRCIRLLLADHIPSIPDFWNISSKRTTESVPTTVFDDSALYRIVNKKADGGVMPLHMAALNCHAETVQLLLDLGACVSDVTVEDGTTIDLIGSGSTPLHYAACGGNAQCCQILISRGASPSVKNSNGWTPLMVAVSWRRHGLEGVLSKESSCHIRIQPSPYLCLPLMSIMKIARKYGWRDTDLSPAYVDPCVVCLERKCTVAAEGCAHEFCTRCALYLCSTSPSSNIGPPGSIACPLCRHCVVSFFRLPGTNPIRIITKPGLSLSLCGPTPCCRSQSSTSIKPLLCKPELGCSNISGTLIGSQRFSAMKLRPSLCMGTPDTSASLVSYPSSRLQRSVSSVDRRRSWVFNLNQCVSSDGR